MKLKVLAAPSLLAASLFTSPLAMAVDTELKIEGTILTSACEVSVSGNGAYDYGNINFDTILSGSTTVLSALNQNVSISCPAPSFVGFVVRDNRNGTESTGGTNPTDFGLNLDPAGNPIGVQKFWVGDPVLDGSGGRLLISYNRGGSWSMISGGPTYRYVNEDAIYTYSSDGTPRPTPHMTSVFSISGQATIVDRDRLDLTRGLNLDGSATFELFYL